jgi:hypothetical protein
MTPTQDHITYDYWSRFIFLRFYDSLNYPVMVNLIDEIGGENVEILTEIFFDHVLPYLDAEHLLIRLQKYIFSQEYIQNAHGLQHLNIAIFLAYKSLYGFYKYHDDSLFEEKMPTIRAIFLKHLQILRQQVLVDTTITHQGLLYNIQEFEDDLMRDM